MDVRMLGVVVLDRDPVEPRSEILLGVGHQVAGERLEVGHVGRVLGRDDEAEVVAIVDTALGKGAPIGLVVLGVEQAAGSAVFGDAVALQVGDMGRERRRARAVPDDARLDGHEPRSGIQSTGGALGWRSGRGQRCWIGMTTPFGARRRPPFRLRAAPG